MRNRGKDGNTKWQIVIELGKDPETGKRKRKYETVRGRKAKAEKRMAELITKIEKGTYIEPSEMTVADLLDKWLESYCKQNLAARSYDSYQMIVNKHLKPALGDRKLQKLTAMDIQTYQNRKLNELSATTVQNHNHLLSQALSYGVKMQLLEANPAEVVKAPPRDEPEINYLTEKEVKEVLNEAKGKWIHDFIYLAVHTGMRRGELLALEWSEVDLEQKKIQVVKNAQRVRNEGIIFKEPKSKSSKRSISISDGVVEVLKGIKKKQAELKLASDDYSTERDLVFCEYRKGRMGEVCNPYTVTRRFKRVAEAAGYPACRLHDLRHSHATMLLTAGVHPKVVKERLGHSSIRVTLDTYSHVAPTLQEEAAEKLDKLVTVDG